MAALTPVAQGVGQFATDLISAPFKEPAKRFMTTDYGQQIKRAKKLRRASQAELAAEAKRISDSGMGALALYTREAGENIDRGYAQQLGQEQYEANKEFYATSREASARENAEKRYKAFQDASKSLSQTYTDEDYADALAKYGSESPNAAVSLWRGTKRLLGVGKTNEELRKEAFNNIVDTMDLGTFVDLKSPKLIELKKQIETGMRPFNPQQIAEQLKEDNKNNSAFQAAMTAKEQALKDNTFYREQFPIEYADLISQNGGSIKKAQASMRERIRSNATLDDPRLDKNQSLYRIKYMGDATISGDAVEQLVEGYYATLTGDTYDTIDDDAIEQYREQVTKQVEATIANVYVEATRVTQAQLYKLNQENPTKFAQDFGDSNLAAINKEALILRNMDKLIENSLEETTITVDGSWNIDKEISVQTGRLIRDGIPDFNLRVDDAEQGGAVEDDNRTAAAPTLQDQVADATDTQVDAPTTVMQKIYKAGSTAQAYKIGRDSIILDIKTRRDAGQFETAEEAVEYGLKASASLGQSADMPDLSTVNGRAAIKGSVFAADGDTQKFSIGGGTKSLLGRNVEVRDATYTLSLDGGQVNVSVSQPGEASKRPLTLEEIPEGNIKNHLTYLKKTYQENISELESIGVDDPSSRSLSGLGGKARELKMINNEILGAIDLPGLGDRGDVISFLTATPVEKPQQTDSLLSKSTAQTTTDPLEAAKAIRNVRNFNAMSQDEVEAIIRKTYDDDLFVTSVLENLYGIS